MPCRVCVFGMGEVGHFQRLRPIIASLAGAGAAVSVVTDPRFRSAVAAEGGRFVDLLERLPLESADSESIPVPCRFVTYAGRYADEIVAAARAEQPELILYDTFAVMGRVAARALGVPYVNVCAGHARDPESFAAELAIGPKPAVSAECDRAATRLREEFGIADASPFCYATGVSPHLNIYCEPPEMLPDAARAALEPIRFFGSIGRTEPETPQAAPWPASGAARRVYASFGSVVWRYWADEAVAALQSLAAVAAEDDVEVLIGLGGVEAEGVDVTALRGPRVAAERDVDQWAALSGADAFLTHQGLNSTHEAIWLGVPMISYPFFADQPRLAERCAELGLAVPLAERRAPVEPEHVRRALAEVERSREGMDRSLAQARGWQEATIADRDDVVAQCLALAGV